MADLELRRKRFDAALAALRAKVELLEAENETSLWLYRNAGELVSLLGLPGSAQWWPAWRLEMEAIDSTVAKLKANAQYLEQIQTWEKAGVATFEASTTVPGDLDLVVDPESVPAAPEALTESALGLVITGGVIAIVAIIGATVSLSYGANVLIEREKSKQNQLDFEFARSVTEMRKAGTLTAGEATELLRFVRQWREENRKNDPLVPDVIPEGLKDVVKWGVIGVLGYMGLQLAVNVTRE